MYFSKNLIDLEKERIPVLEERGREEEEEEEEVKVRCQESKH